MDGQFQCPGTNSRKYSTSSSSESGRPASPLLSNDPLAVIQDLKFSIHKRTHEITSVNSKYDSAFSLETQTLLHHLHILSQNISNIEVNTLVNLNHKKRKSSSKKVRKDLEQLGEVYRELDVVRQKFSGSIERGRRRMEAQEMNELTEKKMEKEWEKERVKNEAREQKERKAQAQEAHKLIKSLMSHTSYLSKSLNKLTNEIPSHQRRFADPEYIDEVAQILSHVIQLATDFAMLKPMHTHITSTSTSTPFNTIQLQSLKNTLYQLVSRLTNIERFYTAANDAYYRRHSHSSKTGHQRRKEERYKHNIALENDLRIQGWEQNIGCN